MEFIYLREYNVSGIKSITKELSLSFYKKTVAKDIDTQIYNVKGIYGINGSGKSAIMSSVSILKQILYNRNYLNNPLIQKQLDETINKKTKHLKINLEYFALGSNNTIYSFYYTIELEKDSSNLYYISHESLKAKKSYSRNTEPNPVFEIVNGEILELNTSNDEVNSKIIDKTKNLLRTSSLSSLYTSIINKEIKITHFYEFALISLFVLSQIIHVYMENQDTHEDYFITEYFTDFEEKEDIDDYLFQFMRGINSFGTLNNKRMVVSKERYDTFEKKVKQLEDFIKIFKSDLSSIDIERTEDKNSYVCQLIMNYDSYSVSAEFESTGIKKLIKLFEYLKAMVKGEIIFIDELDSNLHDVYLCSILEYLMTYGKGQLCFTTHNIGPMDILKRNKNSIDFLSANQSIVSWKNKSHYQPSKLYKDGMIEGSPFNIDSIDFVGILDEIEE